MKNQIHLFFFIVLLTAIACSIKVIPPQLNSNTFEPFNLASQKNDLVSDFKGKVEITEHEVLNTDLKTLKSISDRALEEITIIIPSERRRKIELDLKKVNIFSSDFQVTLASNKSPQKVELGVHYRGKIKGNDNSTVSISIYEDELIGFISSDNGNYVIGKLKDGQWRSEHIIYNDRFIFQSERFECGTEVDGEGYNGKDLELTNESQLVNDCIRLYIEVDFDIYSNFGSLNPTINHITALMNQVITLYSNESINSLVSEIRVWDVQSPYSGTSSTTMLNSFQANTGTFNGDLAQLLSYKASGGIAAGFSGLCNSNVDNSKSFSSIGTTFSNVPTYSWSVMVVTHEFGHLWGSRHTHACVWNGNNTAIDGCAGVTEPPGGCPLPGIPSVGGTIMSYCHLQNVGINFNQGFGLQPGNVIRNNVIQSNCTNSCCDWSFGGFMDSNDNLLIADANGDGKDDLVFFNKGGSGSALRVIDLTTMNDIKSMSYTTLGGGWSEPGDRALIADANGDGNDDLVLFNTDYSLSAIALRVIDLTTMNDIKSMSYTTLGGGWSEPGDRALIADANGDSKDDLVLFNTGGSGSALRVIDLTTMNDIKSMSYTTLGGGWSEPGDRALIADANGDSKDDLVLFNTGGSGSALRVIDLTTMNDITSMSYSTLGGGWNDSGDRALIADANGDGKDDLVLFNTGGSGSALRVIDLTTMNDITSMSYSTLGGGWNDSGDRALIADANGDGKDDLVLFNTGGSGSALRVIDLTTMNDIKSMSYSTLGGGWNDSGDRALIADANGDGKDDLVLINTGYTGSAIRVINLVTMVDISSISHCNW